MKIKMIFLVVFLLTLVNGVFAMSEIALVSLNEKKVKNRAEAGDAKSKTLYHLLQDSNKFLSTIQIGITFAGFLTSAFGSEAFANMLIDFIGRTAPQVPVENFKVVIVVIITLILSFFSIVVGEMVPKRIGMNNPEKVSYAVGGFIHKLSRITSPIVALLSASTNLIVKAVGIDPNKQDNEVTEEEIRLMVDAGEEEGSIQENEKVMIENIFNFDNKPVTDVMTTRRDMVSVDVNATYEEVKRLAFTERYSRYPVFEGTIDKIIGTFHLKDLLTLDENNTKQNFDLRKILRKPYFAPETMRSDRLFAVMQSKKLYVAIILDEWGSAVGMVTLEDLLEEIVGDIFDEYDHDEIEEVRKVAENQYLADGVVSLDKIEDLIKADLPLNDFETLSGFIIGELGYLPTEKDQGYTFEYNGYEFRILLVENRFVEEVSIHKITDEENMKENISK